MGGTMGFTLREGGMAPSLFMTPAYNNYIMLQKKLNTAYYFSLFSTPQSLLLLLLHIGAHELISC